MITAERTKGDEKYETDSKKLFWRNLEFLRTCISSSNKSHVVIHKPIISFSKYITSPVNIKKRNGFTTRQLCVVAPIAALLIFQKDMPSYSRMEYPFIFYASLLHFKSLLATTVYNRNRKQDSYNNNDIYQFSQLQHPK